ncbi:MAG: AAA family ATPase [Bacteroidales bacterium]|nr:AAA family ATPase [Bacteroidales bacterium]
MLKSVALENFKCFGERKEFPLAQITIMYGKNGRGKSTVAQSLLLLAQTMVDNNSVENLQLTGKYVSLGTFKDIINAQGEKNTIGITIKSDKLVNDSEETVVEMEFGEHPNKPQMALVSVFNENGASRFVEMIEKDAPDDSIARSLGAVSDIQDLQMLKSTRYVSAGRLGPQNFAIRKDKLIDDDLGVDGENVINVLSRMGIDFIDEVERTLSEILGGAAIRISFRDEGRIELYLNSKDGNTTYRPVNVGFGYSYVLPVVVAAHLAERNSLLIVENPEAHLHPGAQSRIMKFLIEVSKQKNLQLIIETHSDHVVNGLRIAMKEGVLNVRDGHILHFSDDEKQVRMITCDCSGTLSDYPDDFLDEWTAQMLELV